MAGNLRLDSISTRDSTKTIRVDTLCAATPAAWVRFSGSTGAIESAYNVSSVTRSSAGKYALALQSSLVDAQAVISVSTIGAPSTARASGAAVSNQSIQVNVDDFAKSADDNWEYVTLLCHCNGANDTTLISDSSRTPKLVQCYGSAKLLTSAAKFGSTGIYLNGTSDYIRVDSALHSLSRTTDAWTIECWCYQTAAGSLPYIIGVNSKSAGANIVLVCPSGATLSNTDYTFTAFSMNAWHHVAATYDGSTFRVFIDGVVVTQVTAAVSIPLNQCTLAFGAEFDSADGGTVGNWFPGYIDEIRVTSGVARYTGAFSVPTEAFPDSLTPAGVDATIVQVAVYR